MRTGRVRGLTMIEVLVATALFVLAFLVFMAVWPTNGRALTQARNAQTATSLAQYALEATLYGGYAGASSLGPISYTVTDFNNGVSAATTFTYTVTVTSGSSTTDQGDGQGSAWGDGPGSGAAPSNAKDILVTVQWSEGKLVHNVKLETLLANLP